jgi:Predicted membrane protein
VIAEFRRMAAYVVAGFAATGVHYAVMFALVTWEATPEVIATCAGFVAGALVKYPLNYWGVFSSRQRHRVAVARYVISLAVSFVLNAALFALLLQILSVHYMVSQVLTTGAVLVANYLMARLWIFHGRADVGEPSEPR